MCIGRLLKRFSVIATVIGFMALQSSFVHALSVQVTIQNLSPAQGIFLTPVWVGFHDGGFDLYDRNIPLNPGFLGMESLVEDGDTGPLSARFAGDPSGVVDGTIVGLGGSVPGPIDPGETVSQTFILDNTASTSQYFSYASMVIPSNDAFIANGNPLTHQILDGSGTFLGADFIVSGSEILDAGTEENDELLANTAFLGQAVPNTGLVQNGTVQAHPGFLPGGNILTAFPNGDFTTQGFQVARITVSVPGTDPIPEPSTVILFGSGLLGMVAWRFKNRKNS